MLSYQRKIAVLALLMNSSKAAITEHANGLGGNAPCVDNYIGVWENASIGYDPHAVHGLEANDGGMVGIGMALKTEGGTEKQGFVVKTQGSCETTKTYFTLSKDGTKCDEKWDWAVTLGTQMLWIAESPDKSYFIAVGLKDNGGKSQMYIAKLKATDGSKVWEMSYGTGSGAETVAFTSDGGFVIGGYLDSETPLNEQNFKSGGQIESGTPIIAKISKADADGTTAPSKFDWSYEQKDAIYTGSAKALRVDSTDAVIAIAGTKSSVIKLKSDGTEEWKSGQLDSGSQMNDLEIASDGYVLVGHEYTKQTENCWFDGCGVIKGHMKKLDSTGKKVEWTKTFGNYPGGVNQFTGLAQGDWAVVYNECWGVSKRYKDDDATHDGYVLACGTGVEGCNMFGPMMPWLYMACAFDPRIEWRSLAVATDLKGELTYYRQDNFQPGEGAVASSAAEYVFTRKGGKHTIITDEKMGMGFETIDKYTGTLCTEVQGASKLTMTISLAALMYNLF